MISGAHVDTVEEKGDFTKRYGRISVGILLVQDVVVIILLTFLVGFRPGETPELGAIVRGILGAFGGMSLLLVGVVVASRYVLPKPFAWASGSPETLFIWSLCWCFFVVLGAHYLGLSDEVGAFLAGLSLAQLPYSGDLRRRVHPLRSSATINQVDEQHHEEPRCHSPGRTHRVARQ